MSFLDTLTPFGDRTSGRGDGLSDTNRLTARGSFRYEPACRSQAQAHDRHLHRVAAQVVVLNQQHEQRFRRFIQGM